MLAFQIKFTFQKYEYCMNFWLQNFICSFLSHWKTVLLNNHTPHPTLKVWNVNNLRPEFLLRQLDNGLTNLLIKAFCWHYSSPGLINQCRISNPMLRFGVLPSVDVACEECCCCMQRCWFPQTLPTRQSRRFMSTVLTPD